MQSRRIGLWTACARRISSGSCSAWPCDRKRASSRDSATRPSSHEPVKYQTAAASVARATMRAMPLSPAGTSDRRVPVRSNRTRLASTGISVKDSTIEPANAKMTVSAIGRNNLPSIPSRVRIGT
jgi:hypothetical protein